MIPRRARSSAPTRMCVVVAGCVTIDFESPRLLEISISFNPFMIVNAASLFSISNATIVPPDRIWRMANACCG